MTKRTLLLLGLFLLLIPAGMTAAQSPAGFSVQHFVITGGGAATSAGFSVTGIIGQPVAAVADSPNFKLSGGFVFPNGTALDEIWLPAIYK